MLSMQKIKKIHYLFPTLPPEQRARLKFDEVAIYSVTDQWTADVISRRLLQFLPSPFLFLVSVAFQMASIFSLSSGLTTQGWLTVLSHASSTSLSFVSPVNIHIIFFSNARGMEFLATCACVAVMLIAYGYMLIFLVSTNVLLNKYAAEQQSVEMVLKSRIDAAVGDIRSFNVLKAYTLALNVDLVKALVLSDSQRRRDFLDATRTKTAGLGVYVHDVDAGAIVPASSVAPVIKSGVEFLVFKSLGAGEEMYQAYIEGSIEFAVVGGRTFLLLPWVNAAVTKDFGDVLGKDLAIPVVALLVENFLGPATAANRKYTMQDSILNAYGRAGLRSLQDVIDGSTMGLPSRGYGTVGVLTY